MSSPRCKRARLDETQSIEHWADLEPGLWEAIFGDLQADDKREVRLVCKLFRDLASRTIHQLELTQIRTEDGVHASHSLQLAVSLLLAVMPLRLCRAWQQLD